MTWPMSISREEIKTEECSGQTARAECWSGTCTKSCVIPYMQGTSFSAAVAVVITERPEGLSQIFSTLHEKF